MNHIPVKYHLIMIAGMGSLAILCLTSIFGLMQFGRSAEFAIAWTFILMAPLLYILSSWITMKVDGK